MNRHIGVLLYLVCGHDTYDLTGIEKVDIPVNNTVYFA